MEKISCWSAHTSNEEVLSLVPKQRSLRGPRQATPSQLDRTFPRHECLLKIVLEEMIKEKRTRKKNK